jgi:hypothetical protein
MKRWLLKSAPPRIALVAMYGWMFGDSAGRVYRQGDFWMVDLLFAVIGLAFLAYLMWINRDVYVE